MGVVNRMGCFRVVVELVLAVLGVAKEYLRGELKGCLGSRSRGLGGDLSLK